MHAVPTGDSEREEKLSVYVHMGTPQLFTRPPQSISITIGAYARQADPLRRPAGPYRGTCAEFATWPVARACYDY